MSVTATATAAATATATALTFLSFVDTQRTTTHVFAIQCLDSTSSISIGHFNETETTGTSRFAVVDHCNRGNSTVSFKHLANFAFVSGKRQIAYINLSHTNISL